jgi:hypothetical protein
MKWRGLWAQCPYGQINDDGTVTWARTMQWPFRAYHGLRFNRNNPNNLLTLKGQVGHVYIVADRDGINLEGGLWPTGNYRVTACGDVRYDMQPACAGCNCGLPYGGHVNLRDHNLDITWLHTWPFVRVDAC